MKKVLIVGRSAKEYSLAKRFLASDRVSEVFVAPGNSLMQEFCKCIDIREDNVSDLLKFVIDNKIDMTVASSDRAIKADIAAIFQANSQLIFAPTLASASFALSKSYSKKFLYKLRIPTPRFGVFEKEAVAVDYLKTSAMPVVIRMDEDLDGRDRLLCSTFLLAKTFVSDLYSKGEARVLIEDYVYGHEFTFYILTDGYSALPLGTVANYKFMEDGDGGLLTSGVGAFVPDYKISSDIENYILKNIAADVLDDLEKKGTPYVGILGFDCVQKADGSIVVLDFRTFLSDHDCKAVINLVQDDIYTLFEACIMGALGDDFESVTFSDSASVSCVVYSRKSGEVASGIELLDEDDISHFDMKKNEYLEYIVPSGKAFVVTKTSNTLSRARTNMYDDIELIKFDGKKYRSDICPIVK